MMFYDLGEREQAEWANNMGDNNPRSEQASLDQSDIDMAVVDGSRMQYELSTRYNTFRNTLKELLAPVQQKIDIMPEFEKYLHDNPVASKKE